MEPKEKIQIHNIKQEMLAAILSACVALVALASATYAWYTTNTTVRGTTSTVSAMTDGIALQINVGELAEHDGTIATIAAEDGHAITPASSEDMVNWFVPLGWTANMASVSSYQKVTLEEDGDGKKDGTYMIGGMPYYAYVSSTYTLFSVKNTGRADVYFDGSVNGGAIQVTRSGDDGTVTDKVAASMRVGIVINDRVNGDQLIAVFAPAEPSGAGNDVNYSGNPQTGWRVVSDTGVSTSTTTKEAEYTHISGTDNQQWALEAVDGIYDVPTSDQIQVASNVDWDGVIMKVYIWMEGTDADCIASVVDGDDALYNVTIHLVGVTV